MIRLIEEVVAPLRPTDNTGQVFAVDIQQGQLTHEPHGRTFWSEVRLTRLPDGQWQLTYSHIAGEIHTVYRGKLPLDRTWWLTLLQYADLGSAGRLLSKTSVTSTPTRSILSKTARRHPGGV